MNPNEDTNINNLLPNISNVDNNLNLNLPLMNDNIILNPLTGLLELNPTTLTSNNLMNNMNLVNPLLSQWIQLQQQQQQSLILLNALQQQSDLNLLNNNLNQPAFLNDSSTQFTNSSPQPITSDSPNKLNGLSSSVLQPITSFDSSPQEVPLMSLLPAQLDVGINNLFKEENYSLLEVKEEEQNIELINQLVNFEATEHQSQSGKVNKTFKGKNHNVIEKKYRSSLLDGIESLKDSLPFALDEQGKIYSFIKDIKAPKKFSKSTILNKSKEYIEYLKMENEKLKKQNNAWMELNSVNQQVSPPLSSSNSNTSSSPQHNGGKNTRFYMFSFMLILLFYLPFYHPTSITNSNEKVISLSSFPFISIMFLFSLFILVINPNMLNNNNNNNNNNGKHQLQLSFYVNMLDTINSVVKLISTAIKKWTKNDVVNFNQRVTIKDVKLLSNLESNVSNCLSKWMIYVYNVCIILTKLINVQDSASKMELIMISIILNSQYNLNTESLINHSKKDEHVKLLRYFISNYKTMDFNSNLNLYQYVMDQFNLYQLNEDVLVKDKEYMKLLISKISNNDVLTIDSNSMKICRVLNNIYNNENIKSIPECGNHFNLEYFLKHSYLTNLLNQKDNEQAKLMVLEVRYLISHLNLHKEVKTKLTAFYHSLFISLS